MPREATSGPARTRYECTSCPAPEPGTCTTGDAMATARVCDGDCGSGQCVSDTAGVNRCCLVFSDPSSPNSCPSGTLESYGSPTECARDCTGDCVGDAEGDQRCCITDAASSGGTTGSAGLPEKVSSVKIGPWDIPTDPEGLASALLNIGIGFGTLLAVLFVIIGGFGVATSGGNPDNLEKAKSQITAAIAGLLFILLSVLILSIIGGGVIGIDFFK